jgi:CubicO group peptidase (beta-lactamase class C family)
MHLPFLFVMIALISLAYVTIAAAISIDTSVLKPTLQPFIDSYAFPGASFAVATRDSVFVDAIGHFAYNASLLPPFNNGQNPAVDAASTIYDIASLSKVVATTAAVALLHQENLLDLNMPIASPSLLGPAFAAHGKGSITSLHCLTHSAGFPADPSPNYWEFAFGCTDPSPPNQPRALSTACRGRIFASILDQTLAYPVNSGYIYSDLSFMVLAYVVGAVSRNHTLVPSTALRPECAQMTLDADVLMCYFEAFVRVRIFDALGMRNTRFIPDASMYSRCAPAEDQRSGYARTVIQACNSH